MALIFVLWLVVLLTAIAFQMTYRGHLRARVTATTGDATRAYFLARAGVETAIADLATGYASASDQAAMRESGERLYKNIPLGEGAYTLFASMEGGSGGTYGLSDECAKININTADAEMLGRLTALENGLAEMIVALREEEETFHDLNSLLLIEGVDRLDLYGEDQNGNGLLDSNENDGDGSWPPDDADGTLDGGYSDYLTAWSATRDVDADGAARVNINDDSAEKIAGALADVTAQQAESIVYYREKNTLSSVMNLLDVPLIEKVKNEENPDQNKGNQNGQPPGNPQQQPAEQQQNAQQTSPETKPESDGQDKGDGKGDGKENGDKKPDDSKPSDGEKQAEADRKKEEDSQYTIKETGQKAFNEETFRKLADRVTVEKEEKVSGRINVNTAPLAVLECLPGVDGSVALSIVHERQNRVDGFTSLIDLLDVSGIDMERLKGMYNLICVRSDVFSVRAFGVLNNNRIYTSVSAVLDRTEDEIKILYWQEHG